MVAERSGSREIPQYSLLVAEHLVKPEVLQFGDCNFSSGLLAPMKVVCDSIGENPECLDYITHCFSAFVRDNNFDADTFVGVISGAIPFADTLARFRRKTSAARLGLTRTAEKSALVKGEIIPGSRVVVVEDVITVGTNSIPCSEDVRAEGGEVLAVISLFDYAFTQAYQRFREHNLQSRSMVDFDLLLRTAREKREEFDDELEAKLRYWHDVEAPAFFAAQTRA